MHSSTAQSVRFQTDTLIFDLDGTLVDTAPDLLRATNYILGKVDRAPLALEDVVHMVGFGAIRLMELGLMKSGGMGDHDPQILLPDFLSFYQKSICVDSKPYPHVLDMLARFRADGFQLVLCTNKPLYLAEELLDALNMLSFFDTRSGGTCFPYRKPDPRHILDTLAQLQHTTNPVMIGDTDSDITGARNAGIDSIAVTFGYSATPANKLGATHTISSYQNFPELFLKP